MSQQSSDSEDPSKPVHFRPIMTDKGHLWVPRWIQGLVWDDKISRNEAWALVLVADQVNGWKKKLGREYVRLSRSDWADLLSMSPKGAAGVRDSLLEKGLLRRRKASEAPQARESQDRTGYQYTYVHPDDCEHLDEIKQATDPSSRQNGSRQNGESRHNGQAEEDEFDGELPF